MCGGHWHGGASHGGGGDLSSLESSAYVCIKAGTTMYVVVKAAGEEKRIVNRSLAL